MNNNKKKGFTMVELMVSISIIAIVMTFLVKLLIDAKYDVINEIYDTADQISRAEIIKTIENDLKDEKIKSVADTGSDQNTLKILITTAENKTGIITVTENSLVYKNINDNTKKWSLKGKENGAKYKTNYIKYQVIKNDLNDYVITINIPVLMDNELRKCNDSQMDNIILTFYGNSSINATDDNTECGYSGEKYACLNANGNNGQNGCYQQN